MAEGYGADTWCLSSMTTGKIARGRALLVQALYHRLVTPRGTLRGSAEALTYGLDLAGLIGTVGYDKPGVIAGMVSAELRKDDRVLDVLVDVTRNTDTNGEVSLILTIHVTPLDETGDFPFTLSANDNGVELILTAA
jgi:hypothetical protein